MGDEISDESPGQDARTYVYLCTIFRDANRHLISFKLFAKILSELVIIFNLLVKKSLTITTTTLNQSLSAFSSYRN